MDFNNNGKDDFQEIKDGFDQFITDVATGNINAVVTDVENAGAWLKNELAGLETAAQNFFNWAVTKVKAESGSLGEAVANMLTLLANGQLQQGLGLGQSAIAQLVAITTEVVQAAVGLLGGFKAATA